MRCRRARRLLSAYLDGEVDPRRRASLESHLAGCAACAAHLEMLRQQWETLADSAPAPAPPADLWPQILGALDQDERLAWHRRHRGRLLQAACVAACIALGFAGGALLSWKRPAVADVSKGRPTGERMMVAEAFDVPAFGLGEGREGLLRCVPR